MSVLLILLLALVFMSFFFAIVWLSLYVLEPDIFRRKQASGDLPAVSIVVPAYNEGKNVTKCLDSLLSLNYPTYEIIVVDDGSKDDTAKIVDDYIQRNGVSDRVRLIRHERNRGKAAAVNTGIRNARYDYVAVLDADSHVSSDSLLWMMPHFADPKVGAVSSAIHVRNPDNLLARLQWWEYLTTNFYRALMAVIDVLYVTPGVLSVYRKSVLEEVGLFDENEISEDLEIALRIKAHHYQILFEPNSITFTEVPTRFRDYWRQRLRWSRGFIRNFVKYWKRFGFSREYDLFGMVFFPFLLAYVAVWILYLIFSLATGWQDWYWSLMRLRYEGLTWSGFNLYDFALSQNYLILYISAVWILTGLVVAKFSLSLRPNEREPLYLKEFFVFITLYPLLAGIIWLASVVQEIIGARRSW
ncbi:MAG: glycosyltransferase [Candidatus Diapherotrites archaeon]|nr:glycosyltransferase [Candidatus Diapherotrites archaeon]